MIIQLIFNIKIVTIHAQNLYVLQGRILSQSELVLFEFQYTFVAHFAQLV